MAKPKVKVDGEALRAMNKEQKHAAVEGATSVAELDALWAEFAAAGHAEDGLLHRAVQTKRAELAGEDPPTFPRPAGADLPPITGRIGRR